MIPPSRFLSNGSPEAEESAAEEGAEDAEEGAEEKELDPVRVESDAA